jgi:hypothetical protein
VAIGAVARGDLVIVHSAKLAVHGIFVVDSVSGNAVTVTPVENAGALAGGTKAQNMPVVDKTTDILSVHTATSISA